MKLFREIILGSLSYISINAAASDFNQFDYLGISFQNHSYESLNFSPGIDATELEPLIYKSSSSARGYRVFVGHQFNQYVAVEAGVTSFGKASFSLFEKGVDSAGKVKNNTIYDGQFKTLAGDARIIGTFPLSDSLFLKAHLGALAWDNDFTVLVQGQEQLLVEKSSDTGISLLSGIGLGYGFNKVVAVSLDFEKTEIADITNQSLGLSVFLRF
ncbi:outer membrane beta-barrel protein [Colwelliaceae bacterium 6441]